MQQKKNDFRLNFACRLELGQNILRICPQLISELGALCRLVQPVVAQSPNGHVVSSIHQLVLLSSSRSPELAEAALLYLHEGDSQKEEDDLHHDLMSE